MRLVIFDQNDTKVARSSLTRSVSALMPALQRWKDAENLREIAYSTFAVRRIANDGHVDDAESVTYRSSNRLNYDRNVVVEIEETYARTRSKLVAMWLQQIPSEEARKTRPA